MKDRKLNILKLRIGNLIDEHADALAQAQEFYQELQEAKEKISKLEDQLRNKNVQKEPKVTVLEHPMESPEN